MHAYLNNQTQRAIEQAQAASIGLCVPGLKMCADVYAVTQRLSICAAATLQAGHLFDLHVVYRWLALWLSLSTNSEANKMFGEAFAELPTFKFIPLVYQVGTLAGSGW